MKYNQHFATRQKAPVATPQSDPIPDSGQVPNNAGGFTWAIDKWSQLDRFLILGSEGGTYYLSERKQTLLNAQSAAACIAENGLRVVTRVVEVSDGGRAISNDPALYVLAMAAGLGDQATKQAALAALPQVARTGTHLLHFAEFVQSFRGWGRGLRSAIGKWYTEKPADRLARQVLKYGQRDGWSHADLLRLAHPTSDSLEHKAVFRYALVGWNDEVIERKGKERVVKPGAKSIGLESPVTKLLETVDSLTAQTPKHVVINAITDYKLTHEMIPTEFKTDPDVWSALLPHMPMMATVRNLGNMTKVGLLKPLSAANRTVIDRVQNQEQLVKSRIHPLSILVGLKTYAQGHGVRGSSSWTPVPQICDALDTAFYLAFKAVEPTGKRILYALDVSGSMGMHMGDKPITCAEATAALSLVLANVETNWHVVGFADQVRDLGIRASDSLVDACRKTLALNFGSTDAASAMRWAKENQIDVDAFVVMTDNETWAGSQHPSQALKQYRRERNIPDAKLAVVGMVANECSIADPKDPGMLDVVGFDTALPDILSQFIGYELPNS